MALISGSLVAILIGISLLVCVIGHLVRARIVLLVGLLMVFASTILMMVGGLFAYYESSEPVPDPLRPGPGGVVTVPDSETIGERRQKEAQAREDRKREQEQTP